MGLLEGLVVREPGPDVDGAIVELHGEKNMAATEIVSGQLADNLSHVAAEVQLILDGVEDE